MSPRSYLWRAERRALRAIASLPDAALRRLAGTPPRNDRGHALDAQTHALLRVVSLRGQPLAPGSDVGRQRASFEHDAPLADIPTTPMHRVEDRFVPTHDGSRIRVRIYEPTPRSSSEARPACAFFHGGGFVLGSLESHDGICRHLAASSGAVVISVDYRLSPEHKFPGPADDAIAAFRWIGARADDLGIDRARIAVAGDSAGGNLAACVALAARGGEVAPRFQMLVYPVTDFTHSTDSYHLFREGFLLEAETMRWFKDHHLRDPAREVHDPRGSVLFHDDVRGAAPAYVLTAGFDPLRDEGERYARKLEQAGVPVEHVCAEGLIHGFFSMGGAIREARVAVDRAAAALARALRR